MLQVIKPEDGTQDLNKWHSTDRNGLEVVTSQNHEFGDKPARRATPHECRIHRSAMVARPVQYAEPYSSQALHLTGSIHLDI